MHTDRKRIIVTGIPGMYKLHMELAYHEMVNMHTVVARYSKVFDCDSSQEEIFEHICKPVIDGLVNIG